MDFCSLPPDLISSIQDNFPYDFDTASIDGPLSYKEPRIKVIPLHIYQTWHDKRNMPKSVAKSIKILKQQNPEFEHHLYDEKECRKFIADNFPSNVVEAYDCIIPKAIKADLWRYCLMYKLGGVYIDSKYTGMHGFKFIYLTDKEYFGRDVHRTLGGIYNGFFICKPGNTKLLSCVNQLVENCKKRYYGSYDSCIGPAMVGRFFSADEYKRLEIHHISLNMNERYMIYKGHRILEFCKEYERERKKNKSVHWIQQWNTRNVYKKRKTHRKR
jgi:hypothetical protein